MALRRKSTDGEAKFRRAMARADSANPESMKRMALKSARQAPKRARGRWRSSGYQEDQLEGDHDHLADVDQVVAAAIAAEARCSVRRRRAAGSGALGLLLPELLELFKLGHGIPPSCAARWPA